MSIDFLKGAFQLSPLLSLSLLSFVPLTFKILNKNEEPSLALVFGVGILALGTSLLLFLLVGFNGEEVLSLYFDTYGSGAAALVAMAALLSFPLFIENRFVDKTQISEITFLFLNGVLSLYVFCLAQNLMTAFIGLEITSLVLYIIISMSKKNLLSLEASIKYFILSSLSGIIFLYGLSFLFGSTGNLSFFDLSKQAEALSQFNRFFFLGFGFIFTGLFFKMALFPFHFWLGDVYTGAITPVTNFMATAVKASVVLFIAKLFSLPFFRDGEHGVFFLYGLGISSVLTALFGSFMALNQKKLKRLIVFSSLSHSGYLMMALVGIFTLPSFDFKILFYYLLAYIFMTSGMFTGVQCLEEVKENPELGDLKGLFKKHPVISFLLSCFLLSLAGIPPFFGFFAKLSVLQILVSSQSWWILFWAFVASVLGLYYYIKPIVFMLQKGEASFKVSKIAQAGLGFSFAFTLLGAILFGIMF